MRYLPFKSVLIATLVTLSACATTNVPVRDVSSLSEYALKFEIPVSPIQVDYAEKPYGTAVSQSGAMMFGVAGAFVGALIEASVAEARTATAEKNSLVKAKAFETLYDSSALQPAISEVASKTLPEFQKLVRAHAPGISTLNITPAIGLSSDTKTLLMKLSYQVKTDDGPAAYKNSVSWQTKRETWNKSSFKQALDYGVKETVMLMASDISGHLKRDLQPEALEAQMYDLSRGYFKEMVKVAGWSADRKYVRIVRKNREIISLSPNEHAYLHQRI